MIFRQRLLIKNLEALSRKREAGFRAKSRRVRTEVVAHEDGEPDNSYEEYVSRAFKKQSTLQYFI
jgi:hypothetical protein